MAALAAAAAGALTGCGGGLSVGSSTLVPVGPTVGPATVAGISLRVRGGQQPIVGAQVQIYSAGTTGDGSMATPLMSGQTDATGTLTLPAGPLCTGNEVYAVATGGNPGLSPAKGNQPAVNPNLVLVAAIGPCYTLVPGVALEIDEVTTVAAAAALAPYMASATAVGSQALSTPGTDTPGLYAAFRLASEFASVATGASPGALPTGVGMPLPVVPTAEIDALANALSACVNSAGGTAGDGSLCGQLFELTTPPGGTAPADTLTALLNLQANPSRNAAAIYALASGGAPFQPTLSAAPASFAIAAGQPAARRTYGSYTAFGDSISAGCCAMPARLTSAALTPAQQSLGNFTAITNGGFTLRIDGQAPQQVTGIDLSAAASLTDVANDVAARLTATPFFGYNGAAAEFEMISNSPAASSSIQYLSPPAAGTDLSGLLHMDAASGGQVLQGDAQFVPYVSLVGEGLGLSASNLAASGSTSYDQASTIYAQSVDATGSALVTYAIGTNDLYVSGGTNNEPGGATAAAVPQFKAAILAEDAWLTIPEGAAKQRASGLCGGGAWSASTLQTWSFSEVTTTPGATCGAQVSGTTVYVAYTAAVNSSSSFTVAIDGVAMGGTQQTELAQCAAICSGAISLSQEGRTYGPQAVRFAGLTPGMHTVTVTDTGGAGAGHEVYLDWIGGNGAGAALAGGPRLLMGGTLRQGIGSPYDDVSTGLYDQQSQAVVSMLAADGLNVTFVDVRATQQGPDVNSYLNLDLTHPNESGHASLALAYLTASQ